MTSPRRVTASLGIAIATTFLAIAGCDRAPGPVGAETGGRAPAAIKLATNHAFFRGVPGQPLPDSVRFRVTDAGGAGVRGVRVHFDAAGAGVVSPLSAVTDASGLAATRVTVGPLPGDRMDLVARAEGVTNGWHVAIWASPITSLTLEPDSVVIAAPGLGGGLRAILRDASGKETTGETVEYEIADPTVATLSMGQGTGTYRGQSRGLQALRVGETTVVASYYGVADTARVRVGPKQSP